MPFNTKTHCVRGHELSGDNVSVYVQDGKPKRSCAACVRIRKSSRTDEDRARAAEYHRQWRAAHPGYQNAQNQKWRRSNPEKHKATRQAEQRRYRAKNLDKFRAYARHLRMEVVLAYGGECACCGEYRYEFLSLDHVNNDGAEHRRKHGKNHTGAAFCRWLKDNGYPDFIRILCFNCNLAHGFFGYCPHGNDNSLAISNSDAVPFPSQQESVNQPCQ